MVPATVVRHDGLLPPDLIPISQRLCFNMLPTMLPAVRLLAAVKM